MADVDPAELRRVAEDLYGAAPGDFIATRSAAVKRLRGAGDRATATAVAELRRPTQAAWAVNLLVREQGELVGQLLELGVSMREAQSSLDADSLRELTRERRRLVARVARAAATAVAEEGQSLSEASRRQVEDTLQAAVVDADLAEVVRSGLLVQPLSPTGVASLADVQAIPGAARLELVRGSGGRETGATDDAAAGPKTGDDAVDEREAARAESERVAEERRRVKERTRLQKVRESERRAARSSDSEVARLEQDVATARSRLARAEAELERSTAKREDVRARLSAIEQALDELS